MNIENVNKLIDHLESIKDSEYDQSIFNHDCGTPACVAGHTVYIAGAWSDYLLNNEVGTNCMYIIYCAAEYLGLSEKEENRMFRAFPFIHDLETTKLEATNMLKNFIKTGEVIWRKENEC